MLQDAIWADGVAPRRGARVRRHRHPFRGRLDRGLGVLPGQPRGVPGHRRRRRLAARQQPPAVADERGEQAHLAVPRAASAPSTRGRGTGRSTSPSTRPTSRVPRCSPSEPSEGAYTNDIVTAAHELLPGDSSTSRVRASSRSRRRTSSPKRAAPDPTAFAIDGCSGTERSPSTHRFASRAWTRARGGGGRRVDRRRRTTMRGRRAAMASSSATAAWAGSCCGILTVEAGEDVVEVGLALGEVDGPGEQRLGGDGEELAGIGAGVGTQEGVGCAGTDVVVVGGAHLDPALAHLLVGEQRRAVERAVVHVDLVGELVEHDVTAQTGVRRLAPGGTPRHHQRPVVVVRLAVDRVGVRARPCRARALRRGPGSSSRLAR